MLKINAIRLEINTTGGLFTANLDFKEGLNIIRGNNSTGKSSMFQAILYGLGLEELLGGKNANTMQYVLRDHVNYDDKESVVTQSFVYLEFTNNTEIVTTKRSVVCQGRLPQLVDVIEGPYLTKGGNYSTKPMWLHDSGGATNEDFGFHLFLQNFLNWKLPEVTNSRGDFSRLYIQQVAPAFILEQKTGWSHFLATMPYYNIRNAEGKAIEFLLDLDVAENEKAKRNTNIKKQILTQRWNDLYVQAQDLAQRGAAVLNGFEANPVIINDEKTIFLSVLREEVTLNIIDFVEQLKDSYRELEEESVGSVGDNDSSNSLTLKSITQEYNNISLNLDMLITELALDNNKLNSYKRQLLNISEDLRKNKDLQKLNNLGSNIDMPIANNICPLCKNDINNKSLLPEDLKETPMQLDDNIAYLEAQKKMIEVYIDGQNKYIHDKGNKIIFLQNKATELRQEIRSIKRELVADERLPSEVEIEKRISIRNKIDFYNRLIQDFDNIRDHLLSLSKEWEKLSDKGKRLPDDFYSEEDRKKLIDLESFFLKILSQFNYSSQDGKRIRISMDKYLPVVETKINDNKSKQYDIKYDSSGSDFIRAIWAYTCALKKVSDIHHTNHPQLLMLDEPQQQSASNNDFRTLLTELSTYKNSQVLVFASFNNSNEDYINATKGLDFNLLHIESKIVKPS